MNHFLETWNNPPEAARGMTRWWWYGCAVTKKEITRELFLMKEAGIGGVEIQILYPVEADDRERGIYNIPYFSPKFFEVLRYTSRVAKKLSMRLDFTPASSWPYGGPFIPKEMAPQEAIPIQLDVWGPCEFSYDFTTRINGEIVGILMGKMERGIMCPDTIQDLSGYLKPKELYGWPWGMQLESVSIPEGNYKIVAMVVQNYRQQLGIPSRDAGGYAMDHCRMDVTDFFFQNAVKPIQEKLGKNRIRCFFCDSIELSGNNWTSILLEEFEKRRGYSLNPYLYGLWGDIGGLTEDVRYDYYLTMSELTITNFFERMTEWCHKLNAQSRIQAHGTWADILKAYGSADIPEGESFGPQDKMMVNSIHRRFAASAAHVYGKPLVSNESFTWLRFPRFMETLETMKAAADAIFLDGMNMIVNHGYAYTVDGSPEEGTPFYASCHINGHNTYWPYYKELGTYIQRVLAVMRLGEPYCEVGVYLPQADVWSENPMANLHMGMKLQEYMGWKTADAIQRQGYYFDYLNDEALTKLGTFRNGLCIRDTVYRVILLPKCKRLPAESAKALEAFVEAGGILVAIETIPYKSCGAKNRDIRDRQVKEVMDRLFDGEFGSFKSIGQGCTLRIRDVEKELWACLHHKKKPDARLVKGEETVGYVHRKGKEEDVYFFANISDKYREVHTEIQQGKRGCLLFDCLTGKECRIKSFWQNTEETQISFTMEPFQSVMILFYEDFVSAPLMEPVILESRQKKLEGGFELSIPDLDFCVFPEKIGPWTDYEKCKFYTGTGIYSRKIFLSEEESLDGFDQIDLEFSEVRDIVEVAVNGESCGVLWKKPYRISVKHWLKPGENHLSLKVVNRMINAAIDPQKSLKQYSGEVIDGWPYFTEAVNQIRRKRIDNWRERETVKTPLPAGIWGEIRLNFIRHGAIKSE